MISQNRINQQKTMLVQKVLKRMKFSKIRDLDIDTIEKYRTFSINVSLVLTVLFLQFFIIEAVIAEISPYQAIHSFP